jgi:MoaA/NifB/PqqE/SkfB family radical SAM enzyme
VRQLLGKPSRPQAISLEITRRCVARCIMCNIWKAPDARNELSCDQWLGLLDDPLFGRLSELDVTGGEPFLREDLPDLIGGVCEMAGSRLPALASIAITTNGLLSDSVIAKTREMSTMARRHGIHLVIVCAVDAVDATHDQIRRHEGAWRKVNRTITALCDLRARQPNLILGLKTTIVPRNVDQLKAIRRYAQARGLFTIISPCIITPGRYLNPDQADNLAFGGDEVKQMIAFYRDVSQEWGFHADAMVRVLRRRRRKKTCSAGYNYFFIRSNGDLMLCPLTAGTIGNITRRSVADIYRSKAADRFRRGVARYPQCRNCTEPGLERYALAYEGWDLLAYLRRSGPQRFLAEYGHLGLEKLIR